MTNIERLMNTIKVINTELNESFSTKEYKAVATGKGCCSIGFLKDEGLLHIEKEPITITIKERSEEFDVVSVGAKGERVVSPTYLFESDAIQAMEKLQKEHPENNFYVRGTTVRAINAVRYWYTPNWEAFGKKMQREVAYLHTTIDKLERRVKKDTARLIALKMFKENL